MFSPVTDARSTDIGSRRSYSSVPRVWQLPGSAVTFESGVGSTLRRLKLFNYTSGVIGIIK